MQLKEILKIKGNKVWSVNESDTVHDTLNVLVGHKIGAVLVLNEKGQVVGIISERDIMRECYSNKEGWAKAPVRDVMTKRVIIGKPDDHVNHIMGVMTQNRIRHIPVMEAKQLIGVVSIGDIVKAQLQLTEYEIQYLKDYINGT